MIKQSPFGRTGHNSSRVLLGAAAFWDVPQAEADAAIELALARGINHVDVAASYGKAERMVGSWISRHGRPFFLATKTEQRTAAEAREELQRSLEKLHTHQVDLWQLHNLTDAQEWQVALGPGGALEAAIRAREEGLVRLIGITGHGVQVARMHRQALERFDFDSVLLPYSFVMAQNEPYLRDFIDLHQLCIARKTAVQTIKSIVQSPWGEHPQDRNTWYRPLEAQADIDLAVHWVLGHEGLFLNSAGDTHLLPRVLDAADRFTAQPSVDQMQALADRLKMAPLFT